MGSGRDVIDFQSMRNDRGKLRAHALLIEAHTGRSLCGFFDTDYLKPIMDAGTVVNSIKEVKEKLGDDHFLYNYLVYHFNHKKRPFDVVVVDSLSGALGVDE